MDPLDSNALAERLDVARRIAREAGELTLRYFQRSDLAVQQKQDASPVTVADREAELLLRKRISEAFPQDGILGEEFPEQPGTSGLRWVLDPIDGTKSFIHGVPLYGTLVAVMAETGERAGQGVLGVIGLPALGETVYAARGQGAWYVRGDEPPRPARVSDRRQLADSLVCTTDARHCGLRKSGQGGAALESLQNAALLTRTWGDCYGYLLVATGRAEVMIDPMMNVWDAAAVAPVVEEAGGTFTDWQGQPTIHSGEGIATNGHVLAEVLKLTRGK